MIIAQTRGHPKCPKCFDAGAAGAITPPNFNIQPNNIGSALMGLQVGKLKVPEF